MSHRCREKSFRCLLVVSSSKLWVNEVETTVQDHQRLCWILGARLFLPPVRRSVLECRSCISGRPLSVPEIGHVPYGRRMQALGRGNEERAGRESRQRLGKQLVDGGGQGQVRITDVLLDDLPHVLVVPYFSPSKSVFREC